MSKFLRQSIFFGKNSDSSVNSGANQLFLEKTVIRLQILAPINFFCKKQ